MGDRPWQQPHEQAYYPHAGMVQAASSSAHGGLIKEAGGGYDMAEFDQALFLYLNSQDQTSSAIQDQPQTLNIFPSQPMHVVEPALPKGSMGANNTTPNACSGPSSKRPPPAGGSKDGKTAAVKREAGSSGGAIGSGTPSTSNQQEGPRSTPDAKTLRRLAQNREAARKSRLRKKAYIQNLETSRIRLSQLEQELHRSRTQVCTLKLKKDYIYELSGVFCSHT